MSIIAHYIFDHGLQYFRYVPSGNDDYCAIKVQRLTGRIKQVLQTERRCHHIFVDPSRSAFRSFKFHEQLITKRAGVLRPSLQVEIREIVVEDFGPVIASIWQSLERRNFDWERQLRANDCWALRASVIVRSV